MSEEPSLQIESLRVVAGGRADGSPLGSAVLTPPLRRSRGRDEVAFLAYIDLGEAPSHLYRTLREIAGQTFWSCEGSATAALRRTVAAVNRALFRANLELEPDQRTYGSLTCAAVRDGEVFLAQAGPAWACALCGGLLERFPREELPPLGAAAYAEVRLHYLTFGPHDTVVLGSRWIGQAAPDDVLRVVLAREMDALLDGLEQIGGERDFGALVLRWTVEAQPSRVRPTPAEPAPTPEPAVRPRPRRIRRPKPRRPPGPPIGQRLRTGVRKAGRALSAAGAATVSFMRRMLPGRQRVAPRRVVRREPRPARPENRRLMAGIAGGVLLIVALVTAWAWFSAGSRMRYGEALRGAQSHIAEAQAASDPAVARAHLRAAMQALDGLEEVPEAVALRQQAQAALDVLDKVRRVEPTLLWDFGTDLRPRRLVVRPPFLFVLDEATSAVYGLTLTPSGDGVEEEGPAPILLAQGLEVDGLPARRLLDMVWAAAEGGRTTDGLLILEEGGSLIVSDSWGIRRIALGIAPDQADAVATAVFGGRLYLLDPQAGQIWRYLPEGAGYPHRPEPYFAAEAPRPLSAAQDLAIDGSIYVLDEDGTVTKYYQGEIAPFQITGVPEPQPEFVALALDPQRPDGPVVLADTAGERLVVVAADGAFLLQVRAGDDAFASLQTVAMDGTSGRLYVLAGGRLYVLPAGIVP